MTPNGVKTMYTYDECICYGVVYVKFTYGSKTYTIPRYTWYYEKPESPSEPLKGSGLKRPTEDVALRNIYTTLKG